MWKQDESGRVHTPLEPVVLGATLALIPVLIIEADANSHAWQEVATVANWIIWAIFATELTAVLVVAPRKRAALRTHWLDVAIVVLTIPLLGKVFACSDSHVSSVSCASGSSCLALCKPSGA
jgi:hypothetical protein